MKQGEEGKTGDNGRGGSREAGKKKCLILEQEVNQVVQAPLRDQDVVGIIDSGVTGLHGGHLTHGQGLRRCSMFPTHFLSTKLRQQIGTKNPNMPLKNATIAQGAESKKRFRRDSQREKVLSLRCYSSQSTFCTRISHQSSLWDQLTRLSP